MPQRKTDMPSAWKIVTALLGLLASIALGVAGWFGGAVTTNAKEITRVEHLLTTQVTQESKERVADREKTSQAITETKGKVDQIQKDVERLEKGVERLEKGQKENQEKTDSKLEKILDSLRQRGSVK